MLMRRKLRPLKNALCLLILLGILLAFMCLYFDYSAQLPLVIGGSVLLIQYLLFVINTRRVRVHIISDENVFYNSKKAGLSVGINKRCIYPFKKFEVLLRYDSKYGNGNQIQNINMELKDSVVQRQNISLDNVPYGYTTVKMEKAYLYDMFGFASYRLKGKPEDISLLMIPEPKSVEIDMPKIPFVSGDETEIFYEDRDKDGSETFEIREFERGDTLKKIHWKLSMKMDDFMVRDTVRGIQTNIYVFVDLCKDGKFPEVLEKSISIARELVSNGYPFYFAWLDASDMRMKRKLVIEESMVYSCFAEVMKYDWYVKNAGVMEMLDRFSGEGKEIYNLFILK